MTTPAFDSYATAVAADREQTNPATHARYRSLAHGQSFSDLDKYVSTTLPAVVLGDSDANSGGQGHLTLDQLATVMAWKLMRGKYCATLMGLIRSNDPATVIDVTKRAVQQIRARREQSHQRGFKDEMTRLLAVVKELTVVRGVGPATAAAIASFLDPDAPFMSDELLAAAGIKSPKYSFTEYERVVAYLDAIRAGEQSHPATSVDAVILKELEETLDDTMPEALQLGTIELTPELMKSFFDPVLDSIIHLIQKQVLALVEERRDASDHGDLPPVTATTGMLENMFVVGGFGNNQYLRQRIADDAVVQRLVKRVRSIPSPEVAVLRGAVYAAVGDSIRSRRHLTLDQLATVMAWKLMRGKYCATLMGLIRSNDPATVIDVTKRAVQQIRARREQSHQRGFKDEMTRLLAVVKELTVVRGVGPATAAAIASFLDPDAPFMSDELLAAAGIKSPKYSFTEYERVVAYLDAIRAGEHARSGAHAVP
ncbi:hypothetical protein AMAG_09681 [Allomyces macrogynus ATCC 38327]|uniref:Helix-hairpin-helix DNA-binding motif class 1 domain-containing protein n=1 Tax=Allomyces macrogynus (strain ATCC 38327) TaxID=578462 RepID=A0A0L0STQ5_ALLM3|nr:hypothetical protein AMAG_09681 [Allomyces macrogynus ATCC 38327]|eukprot:KNE65699.1 hypothetical protein AMAG_09681 [Allomyces macrogynus ATCC 38327]